VDPFKNNHEQHQVFLQHLTLFITKSLCIVESVWLQRLTLQLSYKWFFFPIRSSPNVVGKTKDPYVLLTLFKCLLAMTTFDLWMFIGVLNIFALDINFIFVNW
jgi:hypothetical protein